MSAEDISPIEDAFAPQEASSPSLAAEQAVLGALLRDAETAIAAGICDVLSAEDFYSQDHREIYRVFERCHAAGSTFDMVTAAESLQKHGQTNIDGGYLVELLDNTPSSANVKDYAQLVRDNCLRRNLIKTLRELEAQCQKPEERSAATLIEEAESQVLAVGERERGVADIRSMPEILEEVVKELEYLQQRRMQDPHQLTGLATPLPWLNKMTSGLQKSDLIILAGRPGTGKTSLALNIAAHAASHQAAPVVIFSIEMSASAIVQRQLASHSKVFLNRLRSGDMSELNFQKLKESVDALKGWPLLVDASSTLSPMNMRGRLRRIAHRSQSKPALVVVDYLQLMVTENEGRRRGPENRNQELSLICRDLKALAKEFECPVLVLSQLSRGVEQGGRQSNQQGGNSAGRRPMLSDLRDSGAIEQDADLVMFLHRPKVKDDEEQSPDKDTELIIGKHRNGGTGRYRLSFKGALTEFMEQAAQPSEDAAADAYSDDEPF